MPELRIQTSARDDTARIFDWCESESAGLGHRFLETLEKCYEALADNPYRWATVLEDIRCGQVLPFKYLVYYRYVDDVVVVDQIVHAARDQDRVLTNLSKSAQ